MLFMRQLLERVPWNLVVIALLHSLWQASIIVAFVWLALRTIPARRANLRYAAALLGLLVVLPAAMATFHFMRGAALRSAATPPQIAFVSPVDVRRGQSVEPQVDARGAKASETSSAMPSPAATAPKAKQHWTIIAAVFWLAGSLVMLLRAGWLLAGAGRLWRGCRVLDDERLTPVVEQLRRSMRIARPVRLAAGPGVRVPAVFGALAPVVLLPLSMVSGMPVEQLRIILAHELAHVRRHDYLVNLLQLLVEAVLFFNPAIWWLSRQVRIEREACCDALAVAVTGSGTDYVRSLADILGGLLSSQPGLALTPAVRGAGGSVVDRMKRVLVPAHRPHVRMPWYSVSAMAIAAAVALAGMWRGTEAVVHAAERLATTSPAERVERMAQLQRELAPPGGPAVSDDEQESLVFGVVRTSDGSPLPNNVDLTASARRGNMFSSHSLTVDELGHFLHKVPRGRAQVRADAPGYAPAISPMVQAGADGSYPAIDLVLDPGFAAKVRLADRDGMPVKNALVKLDYPRPGDESNTFGSGDYATGDDGVFVVPHARNGEARVAVDVPGFEQDVIKVRLEPDNVTEARVVRAKMTSGVVVDVKTGDGLPGAMVVLLRRDGFEPCTWSPHARWSAPRLLGQADARGRFNLDRLREDSTYTVWVSAPGHASALVQGVRANTHDLRWSLGPARSITLEIHADRGGVPSRVSASNPLRIGDTSYDDQIELPVTLNDNKDVGTAVLSDPLPGTVRFYAGGKQVRADVDQVRGPLVLDLRVAAQLRTQQAMREVVVKLEWPKDGAAPRGKIRVDYIRPETPGSYMPDEATVNAHGEAHVNVPVPTTFGYSQGSLIGYWIEDKLGIDVPAGSEPLVIPVRADPAGAIHGQVLDEHDTAVSKYFYVSLETVKRAPEAAGERRPSMVQPFNANTGSERFLLAPIPLGGTYRVVAMTGSRVVVSDDITLDARQPIRDLNLKFPAGVTLAGTLTHADHTLASGVKVELNVEPAGTTSSHQTSVTTDRDGRYLFDQVNPQAGRYTLRVLPSVTSQGVWMPDVKLTGEPIDIALRAGVTASGRIVDVDAAKGIAGVKVLLRPKDEKAARYPTAVETTTDSEGAFEARGLEPIEYIVQTYDTYPPSAEIIRDANGKAISVRTSGTTNDEVTVKGGQTGSVEIKRRRSPFR